MAINSDQFREVVGRFTTGVAIVTTRLGNEVRGMTVNSFTSLSLEPPLVLFCADLNSDTNGLVEKSGIFAVNILGQGQEALSKRFAEDTSPKGNRFDSVPWYVEATGAPILEGCLAYLDCVVASRYEAGDHVIWIGAVERGDIRNSGLPLVFFGSSYRGLKGE